MSEPAENPWKTPLKSKKTIEIKETPLPSYGNYCRQ